MTRIVALFCSLGVLLAAYRWTYSTSGFLLAGPGLALLLDRYVWRLLPWPPVAWRKELSLLAAFFFGGAVVFYCIHPGLVPVREAAYRGLAVCLAVFLLESFAGLVSRFCGGWLTHRLVRSLLVSLVVLLIPMIVLLHPVHTVLSQTPAASGLAFEDVHFRTADGMELAAWLVPHLQPRGNLVLCHGYGRNRCQLADLLPALHDLGLNVLTFDFRGHGDSEGDTSTFDHHEVQDLVAAVAYLDQRFPGQPIFLVGFSMGAAVALQALPHLPSVRGVWSEGAFARFHQVVDHMFRGIPGWLRDPVLEGSYLVGWLDCGFWGPDVNPIDQLRGVQVPIFFCHGKRDDVVPWSEGCSLYHAYSGPKEHWWVEGASHNNLRRQNEREYQNRLGRFLKGCLSANRGSIPAE